MKRFWQSLAVNEDFVIIKLLGLALVIRLLLAPFAYHSDVNNHLIWGTYAREFGVKGFYDWLNFGNYARPDYPPLAITLFLVIKWIWYGIFSVLWKINITIGLFPSGIVSWFESKGYQMLLKMPAVASDLGVGYLIYSYLKGKTKKVKQAARGASYYLFNPVVIYLSACWGQIEAVVGGLGLLAIIFILKKRYYWGALVIFTAVMVKQTVIPLIPLMILQSIKARITKKQGSIIIIEVILLSYFLGSFFTDRNALVWMIRTYTEKFLTGPATLHYLNLNAFNFWGLLFGLKRISDTELLLGVGLKYWAWGLGGVAVGWIWWRFGKGADLIYAALIEYWAIFMFFPRIHERYLYPVLIFFPIVMIGRQKIKPIFVAVSMIFLLNLYHWWWYPRIGFLMRLLESEIVERGFALFNLILFMAVLREYYRSNSKWTFR